MILINNLMLICSIKLFFQILFTFLNCKKFVLTNLIILLLFIKKNYYIKNIRIYYKKR